MSAAPQTTPPPADWAVAATCAWPGAWMACAWIPRMAVG